MLDGEIFEAATSFPPEKLPIKRQELSDCFIFLIIEYLLQQGMLPKKCMKDEYGVMSTNDVDMV